MTDVPDYGAFAQTEGATPDELQGVGRQAINLMRAATVVKEREEALKEAKEALRKIAEKDMPEAMSAAGMTEMVLKDGRKLKVENVLSVVPLKENRSAVCDWLEHEGHSGKVKRKMTILLGTDEEREEVIDAALIDAGVSESEKTTMRWVEPMTLKAHVKKLLEAGAEVDMDMLNVRQFDRVKITGKAKTAESVFEE